MERLKYFLNGYLNMYSGLTRSNATEKVVPKPLESVRRVATVRRTQVRKGERNRVILLVTIGLISGLSIMFPMLSPAVTTLVSSFLVF